LFGGWWFGRCGDLGDFEAEVFLDPRGDKAAVAEFAGLLIAEENGVLAELVIDGVRAEDGEDTLVVEFYVFLLPVLEAEYGGEGCELGIAFPFPIGRRMKADCDCVRM